MLDERYWTTFFFKIDGFYNFTHKHKGTPPSEDYCTAFALAIIAFMFPTLSRFLQSSDYKFGWLMEREKFMQLVRVSRYKAKKSTFCKPKFISNSIIFSSILKKWKFSFFKLLEWLEFIRSFLYQFYQSILNRWVLLFVFSHREKKSWYDIFFVVAMSHHPLKYFEPVLIRLMTLHTNEMGKN